MLHSVRFVTMDTKLRVTNVTVRPEEVVLLLSRPIIAKIGTKLGDQGVISASIPLVNDFCLLAATFYAKWTKHPQVFDAVEAEVLEFFHATPLLRAWIGHQRVFVFADSTENMRMQELSFIEDDVTIPVVTSLRFLDAEGCYKCGMRGHMSHECKRHWDERDKKDGKTEWKPEPEFRRKPKKSADKPPVNEPNMEMNKAVPPAVAPADATMDVDGPKKKDSKRKRPHRDEAMEADGKLVQPKSKPLEGVNELIEDLENTFIWVMNDLDFVET